MMMQQGMWLERTRPFDLCCIVPDCVSHGFAPFLVAFGFWCFGHATTTVSYTTQNSPSTIMTAILQSALTVLNFHSKLDKLGLV